MTRACEACPGANIGAAWYIRRVAAKFLDAAARAAFASAIEAIEKSSAAEVVVAVRRRSAPYLHANVVIGGVVAIAGLAAMLFSAYEFSLTSTLVGHGLADEVLLIVYPVVLGTGKRFIAAGTPARSFELVGTSANPSGIVLATYQVAGPYVRDGRLRSRETIVDGIENAPRAFLGLLLGENVGKMLVAVGPAA